MRIGIRAHDFGRLAPNDLAREVKKTGFSCVQLAPTKAITGVNSFYDIQDFVKDIETAFKLEDIKIEVLGCYIEPAIADAEKRKENVNIFCQNLKIAKELNIPIVGTETTALAENAEDPKSPTETEKGAAYLSLLESVCAMLEIAEQVGVDVGIEPVAGHTLFDAQTARRLLDEVNSKRLKIIFDPVNMLTSSNIRGQRAVFKNFFDLLGEDIAVLHVKDVELHNNQKQWREIGRGVVNYDFIFSRLRALGKSNIPLLREGATRESMNGDIYAIKEYWSAANNP